MEEKYFLRNETVLFCGGVIFEKNNHGQVRTSRGTSRTQESEHQEAAAPLSHSHPSVKEDCSYFMVKYCVKFLGCCFRTAHHVGDECSRSHTGKKEGRRLLTRTRKEATYILRARGVLDTSWKHSERGKLYKLIGMDLALFSELEPRHLSLHKASGELRRPHMIS